MVRYTRLTRALLAATIVAGVSAWAAPASAATISVNTTLQSPGGSGDCTLGEAIRAANTNAPVDGCAAGAGDDTISLPAGTYTLSTVEQVTSDGAVALPTATSTITIDGANPSTTIIQRNPTPGTPAFKLLYMSSSTADQCWPNCTLTVKDITIQDASGTGGAIMNRAGKTVIDNSTLAGNVSGPAVRTTGRLTVKNSFVTNNVSGGLGGVFRTENEATITGTTFSYNSGGTGGVLYMTAFSNVSVSNSTFDSNFAGTGGVFAGPGTLNVSGSTFQNNFTTSGSGGAIGGVSGNVTVSSSYFNDNSAGGNEGGAIASEAVLSVTTSTFQGNSSDIGGAISSTGPATSISNSTFSANSGSVKGGALFATGGEATVANVTMAQNFSDVGGGLAWEQNGGALELRNSLIATNSGTTYVDCSSDTPLTSQGYNLIGDAGGCQLTAGPGDQFGSSAAPVQPLLGALDNHGGSTKTHPLLPDSPAIDAASPSAPGSDATACEQFDQRLQARPRDGDDDGTFRCDIGAYEGGTGLPLLTAQRSGTGTGLVSTASTAQIDCGVDCAEPYPNGTSVVLFATPTADSVFTSWSGCDSVAGDQCTVSMSSDRTVTAVFTDVQSTLSVNRTGGGQGSVATSGAGVDCGQDCDEQYTNGTTVTLTATPAGNSNFHFWSGCDSTNGTSCTVTMNEDRSVFASFSPIVRTLTVTKQGGGAGTVTSDPEGIDCGDDCGESYQIGSEVTLTATPTGSAVFGGWSGCDVEAGTSCTVAVNANRAVNASFTAPQKFLTVTKEGTAGGTITSAPAGINCPTDCTNNYDEGTSVVLTANPDANVAFTGWTGCDSTNGSQCTVTMSDAKSVSGSFAAAQRSLAVSKGGNGTGTVSSSPAGIDCGGDCTQSYDHGTSVVLTSAPGANSQFSSWSGCDSVNGTQCTVAMNGIESVTANFALLQRLLTVTKSGAITGTVSSSPAGVSCGGDCTQSYDHGTSVLLTADPGANAVFSSWTGCDSVNGTQCTVAMTSAKTVNAAFVPVQRPLTVSKGGNGTGTVSSSPAGVDCGGDCTQSYDHGTSVVLTASPGANSQFSSWSGCDSVVSGQCTVAMNGIENVTANFALLQRNLTVTKSGAITGAVVSSPTGVDCGNDCTHSYDHGTSVVLTADPGPNAVFAAWTGCDSVNGAQCTVAMTSAKTVNAAFTPAQRSLSVSRDGNGTGTVSSSPAGVDCGDDCTHTYDHGTSVVLTATAGANSALDTWTGCDSVNGTQCSVTMNGAESVIATFTNAPRTLTLSKSGAGTGTVTSAPAGVDCGSTCAPTFDAGTVVTLTPAAGANSTFAGWTGCDSVTGNVCTVTMSVNKTVNANFALVQRTLTVDPSRVEGDSVADGSVASDVGNIGCSVADVANCAGSLSHGSTVVLTATPAAGNELAGWVGCDSVQGYTCTVTLTGDRTVRADFHDTRVAASTLSGPAQTADDDVTFTYGIDGPEPPAATSVELWIKAPGSDQYEMVASEAITELDTTLGYTLAAGNGQYSFVSRVVNAAGNREAIKETALTVLYDSTAPTSSVTAAASSNRTAIDVAYVTSSGSDLTGVSQVELWVDGPVGSPELAVTKSGPGAAGTFPFVAEEGAGVYSFHSIAVDGVGNRESAPDAADATTTLVVCPGYETDPRVHIVGTAAAQTLTGTDAAEVICGLGGNDKLNGKGGNDALMGGDANDTLSGGLGADVLDGGAGADTVTYAERKATQPVTVKLGDVGGDGQKNEGDSVQAVETVIGGAGVDILTGDATNNTFKGGAGNDVIKGMAGADKLYGDGGRDKLDGGTKKDTCKTGETYVSCEVR